MADFIIPNTAIELLSTNEQINLAGATTTDAAVFFENDGTASTSTFPVYYENDGTASYSDFVPGSVLPGVLVGAPQNTLGVTQTSGQQVIDNPLHDYSSYTYGISLHLLTPDQYNNLIDNPEAGYVPKNVLISTAGRWGSTFPRNPYFTEDFFIDDLRMKTYVTPSEANRNTNLISCSFTIIEPLGFTLIDNMIMAVATANAELSNYLKMPYMLQIDFFGSTDGDTLSPYNTMGPIKGMTKYLPIIITSLKSKLTEKGTEYQINASPFNHQAFNKLNITNPAACSISGATVQELFGKGEVDLSYGVSTARRAQLNIERQELSTFIQQTQTIGGQEGSQEDVYRARTRLSEITSQLEKSISTNGFTNAINGWYQNLKATNQIKAANRITVVFDTEIGNANLYPSGIVNVAQTAPSGSTETDKKTAIQAAAGQNKGQISFNNSVLTVPAGTTIDKLIDWAVRNSEYIGKQLTPDDAQKLKSGAKPGEFSSFGQPLRWYKIIPKIKIQTYDELTNNFSMDITLFVKPYTLSTVYPFAPQGRVPGYVKRYDYIFTGKNKDVLDCRLDFNTLYYVSVTAYKDKIAVPKTGGPLKQPQFSPTAPEPTPRPASYVAHPVSLGLISGSTMTTDRTGAGTRASALAGDLQRAVTVPALGDMIKVELKILGDPHFIKQDDVFYAQNLLKPQGQFVNNNLGSSLWFDGGELYIFLNFQSPTDYDETTGLANPSLSRFRVSEMSGVYKIVSVDNIFSRGKFEQSLTIVKVLYDQQGKPTPGLTVNRLENPNSPYLGPLVSNQYNRFIGSRVNLESLAGTNTTAATLATLAAGGSSALSSILRQGVNSAINKVVGQVSQEVGKVIGKAVSGVVKSAETSISGIKYDVFGPSTSDLLAADQADAFYNGTSASTLLSADQADLFYNGSMGSSYTLDATIPDYLGGIPDSLDVGSLDSMIDIGFDSSSISFESLFG